MAAVSQAVMAGRSPTFATTSESTAGSSSQNLANYTYVNRNMQLPSGAVIYGLGVFAANAVTGFAIKIIQRVSAGSYNVIASKTFNHPGGSIFTSVNLDVPVQIPATGSYYVGVSYPAAPVLNTASASIPRAYIYGNSAVGGPYTYTEDTNVNMITQYTVGS